MEIVRLKNVYYGSAAMLACDSMRVGLKTDWRPFGLVDFGVQERTYQAGSRSRHMLGFVVDQ